MGQPVPDDDLPGGPVPDNDLPNTSATQSPQLKTWTGSPQEMQGLQNTTPFGYALGSANVWLGGEMARGAQWLGVKDPASIRDIENIPQAVETFLGLRGGLRESYPEVPEAEPHPLSEAATAESSRLEDMRSQAQAAGLNLPDKEVSRPQQVANNLARQDLQLPVADKNGLDAPLTPEMLRAANKQYVSPAYEAIQQYPTSITLSDATKATLDDVRPLMPSREAATLPTGDAITGQQAVDLSKALRAKANQFPDFGVNADNLAYSKISQAHVDAARAIENDVRSQLTADGNAKLADDWDAARVYRAKSGAYEEALDGAGNVRVPELKKQLFKAGVPLSGNAEMLANVGAQYPELFRATPAAPQPSILRKAAARSLPAIGGAVGAHFGPFGAALGVEGGENLGRRLLGQ